MGLHAVNVYLATTVMPSVIEDIDGARLYAWATTIFTVASVLGSVLASTVLDRVGPRAAYRWSAATLLLGTVVCALAPTMVVLLAGRALQGLAGGLLFALCYSVVRLVFEEELWPRALAMISAMWGIATLLGPALGGVWAQAHQWRGAFWTLVPLLAIIAAFGAAKLPDRAGDQTASRVPWVALGLLTAAVLVVSSASVSDQVSVNVIGLLLAAALMVLWVRHERRASVRVMPTATFSADHRLRRIYLTMSFLLIAVAVEVFVPFFGQRLQGLNPLEAGYLGAAMAAGWTLGSLALSGVTKRRTLVIATSPAFVVVGLVLLTVFGPMRSSSAAVALTVGFGLILAGWGVGAVWPHLFANVMRLAGDDDQGIAGSSLTTVQLTAIAFGSAIAGAVANTTGFADPATTSSAARWLFGVFLIPAVAALIGGILVSRPDRQVGRPS
nr:Multidrug resistance protein B [Kibdelosporangium sp. MJ126-NF4]